MPGGEGNQGTEQNLQNFSGEGRRYGYLISARARGGEGEQRMGNLKGEFLDEVFRVGRKERKRERER